MTTTTTSAPATIAPIIQAQLTSLSDTDCYASSWEEALERAASNHEIFVKWGGRGQGGRGLGRRTFQPHDIVVDQVRLEYVSQSPSSFSSSTSHRILPSKLLLESATLKLLAGHVYGIMGRNGVGKSTLLRRIHAGQIPGFPTHLTSLYIPQEGLSLSYYSDDHDHDEEEDVQTTTPTTRTKRSLIDIALAYYQTFRHESLLLRKRRTAELEQELEQLDMTSPEDAERVEELCQQVAAMEEEQDDDGNDEEDDGDLEGDPKGKDNTAAASNDHFSHQLIKEATEALKFFGFDHPDQPVSSSSSSHLLSAGQRVKVALACALFCRCDLLLLDEPKDLDIHGLLQLRRLIQLCAQQRKTIVLLISHDVDLVNDVATDIIHVHHQQLTYYPGNYHDFLHAKEQKELHQGRQHHVLEKKREAMIGSIEQMKKQPAKGSAQKKKGKAVENYKKKLERVEMNLTTSTTVSSEIHHVGSSVVDAPAWKTKRGKAIVDKAVQFVFRNTTCTWGEPLITAMEVSHRYPDLSRDASSTTDVEFSSGNNDMLLECVDLCVDEAKRIVVLGSSACGKSTLLRLLAKQIPPTSGKVHHALNVTVGLLDQHAAESLMEFAKSDACMTALSYLAKRFPLKSEQDLRAELKAFGLGPHQISTSVQFMSGGERSRLCFTSIMLEDPQVLLLDTPTSHLDVESVEALVHGLNQWNGTLVIASHDAYLIRSINNAECFVILDHKLFRLRDGLDRYLKTFRL